jgi:23S rRNA (cytosine1962-C5)-methyltransferase
MHTQITEPWSDYELIDSGAGQRLERFAGYLVVRPDPQVLWQPSSPNHKGWKEPDAHYVGKQGVGFWEGDPDVLAGWPVSYAGATFTVRPTAFRHVGLFPEQASQWEWMQEQIAASVAAGRRPRVLNLFAYTGAASILAAQAGASVCHVDASAGSVNWAKENAKLSGLPADAIRWIVDEVSKFLRREVRRGAEYDMILLDPPVFGRGPKGEVWRLEERIEELALLCSQLLSKEPLGVVANLYATTLHPLAIARLFTPVEKRLGHPMEWGTLSIRETGSEKLLPTGFWLRS